MIAVNLDGSAPIAKRANLTVVGDAQGHDRRTDRTGAGRARAPLRGANRRPRSAPVNRKESLHERPAQLQRIAVLVSVGRHPVSGVAL